MSTAADRQGPERDIDWRGAIPFALAHLACFGAIFSGVTWEAVILGVGLYWLRIFAIGAGYHRYFAHRSYATSRAFQLVLAVLSQSTAQKSVLWWAAMHRRHHRDSDAATDPHSPRRDGFLYAHVGWIFERANAQPDLAKVADLTRFPELRWLHRHPYLAAVALAAICFLVAGWPGLFVGFFCSTVAVWHATFCINSLAHVAGRKRYVTGDDSRNNLALALATMGEGWHNNHHAWPASVRQGFRWWELDLTYLILRGLERIGLVWDLKHPPEAVRCNQRPLGAHVIDKAAAMLAVSFAPGRTAPTAGPASAAGAEAAANPARHHTPDLAGRIADAGHRAVEVLAAFGHSALPTRHQLLTRARAMFPETPSLDAIVTRSHALLLEGTDPRLSAPTKVAG